MSTKVPKSDDGGLPAFPVTDAHQWSHGMTYRQWLVGQAIAGLCAREERRWLANGGETFSQWLARCRGDIARDAVAIADATIDRLRKDE